jgi:hypothetical protein
MEKIAKIALDFMTVLGDQPWSMPCSFAHSRDRHSEAGQDVVSIT